MSVFGDEKQYNLFFSWVFAWIVSHTVQFATRFNQNLTKAIFQINSSFFDIGNVNIGNDVKIKGVKVGEVSGISLDQESYMAIITSSIDENVKIPDNSTFKISNNGFIGSPYIEIQLGESEELLKNNDYTTDNIDAVSLEEIINNFIFK